MSNTTEALQPNTTRVHLSYSAACFGATKHHQASLHENLNRLPKNNFSMSQVQLQFALLALCNCTYVFGSFCKVTPDDALLNGNMQHWMTNIKLLF